MIDFGSCGQLMYDLVAELFPICRSITGAGLRETLRIINEHLPLTFHEIPSGTVVFDWIVPPEWNIRDAYILDARKNKVVDFQESNLHVVGYSTPIDKTVTLAELQKHLHSLENMPDAIPYVTSYYKKQWGFCISHRRREGLKDKFYHVFIDSELKKGSLTYADLIIPGVTDREILLSTYVCHPSMANNELSGPAVTVMLAKWLGDRQNLYTYRIVFVPETIGSLCYLSRNFHNMKRNTVAGFNITCVGDDRVFSYLPSRNGATLADRVALKVLEERHPGFARYSYLDRGSDERQYCSPGVDLPLVSVMRSKYGEYPEYHTSMDNLSLVTATGLQGSFDALRSCLELLERNRVYRAACVGEPHLARRGLYPQGSGNNNEWVRHVLDILAYADGTNDLIALGDVTRIPMTTLIPLVDMLVEAGLLVEEGGG